METTFLDRLKQEQKELQVKIEKLSNFILSNAFTPVTKVQKRLLVIQLDSMRTYNQCLIQRIEDLNE